MDLFLLDPVTKKRDELVEKFKSLIWTERYDKAGDAVLTIEATPENVARLTPGRRLQIDSSEEAVTIQTRVIEKKMMTVNATGVLADFDNSIVRYSKDHASKDTFFPRSDTLIGVGNPVGYGPLPGEVIKQLVGYTVGGYTSSEKFPDEHKQFWPDLLVNEYVPPVGERHEWSIPYSNGLYSCIQPVAEDAGLGIRLTLDGSQKWFFQIYTGLDQSTGSNPLTFSTQDGSLSDAKELESWAKYKTCCVAWAPNWDEGDQQWPPPGIAYVPGTENLVGSDRRVMQIFCDDVDNLKVGDDANRLKALLDRKAAEALVSNNKIAAVDGTVGPTANLKYNYDYLMGSIVNLRGASEAITTKGRIAEVIRSQDEKGERWYPTVKAI